MENQHNYIERRNQIHRAYKKKKPEKDNFFFLRLNLALAIAIVVVCAGMIDLDITNAFSDTAESIITESADLEQLKQTAVSLLNGEGITAVFAENTYPPVIEENLIAQMQQQADAYENAQKKTN